ncbi:hypothetical protein Aros01_02921 [Streptosporangium roseum]
MNPRRSALSATMVAVALAGSVAVSSPASAASYNSSNGYNCAVAIRNVKATDPWWMGIRLNTQSGAAGEAIDQGVYSTYAGPVYKYGKGKCMWWSSFIWNWDGQKANASKNKTNCG